MNPVQHSLVLASCVMAFAIGQAQAAPLTHTENHTGSSVCDPALPIYALSLRERPAAIDNAGPFAAFVTCALHGQGTGANVITGHGAKSVAVYFTNGGGTDRTASCTASEALSPTGGSTTRSIPVPAGSTQQSIRFTDLDVSPSNNAWRTPALSCSLPPGVGISTIWYVFDEEAPN